MTEQDPNTAGTDEGANGLGNETPGFLLKWAVSLLNGCRKVSLDFHIRRWWSAKLRNKSTRDRYVEGLVLTSFLLAISLFVIGRLGSYLVIGEWLGLLIVVLAVYRIFDLVTFLALDTLTGAGNPGGTQAVASYERTFLLAIINYVEVVFWFASCYAVLRHAGALEIVSGIVSKDGPGALTLWRESLMMMVLNSSGDVKATSRVAYAFFIGHSLVGLFMTAIVLARVVALLRPPRLDADVMSR